MTWALSGAHGLAGTVNTPANTIVTDSIPVVEGELLLVILRWEGVTGDTVTGSLSGAGLSWSPARHSSAASGESQRVAVAWAVTDTTGNITLTYTFDGGATRNYRTWHALRFTYSGDFSLADESAGANGSNTTPWIIPEISVGEGDLVVGILAHFNSGQQPNTPDGFSIGFNGGLLDTYYRIYDTPGDYTISTTWAGSSDSYATIGLVFHETGGGEPPAGGSGSLLAEHRNRRVFS